MYLLLQDPIINREKTLRLGQWFSTRGSASLCSRFGLHAVQEGGCAGGVGGRRVAAAPMICHKVRNSVAKDLFDLSFVGVKTQ